MKCEDINEVYTLPTGEVMTLAMNGNGTYDVDQWDSDGNNRWNRWFRSLADARTEFERWRPK